MNIHLLAKGKIKFALQHDQWLHQEFYLAYCHGYHTGLTLTRT